jgi:hypothetical protein
MRVLLTAAIVVFFVLCVLAMWWGYRNRARRQDRVAIGDIGFRGDDKDVYADWVEALQSLTKGGTAR